jgi:hypothetical protein
MYMCLDKRVSRMCKVLKEYSEQFVTGDKKSKVTRSCDLLLRAPDGAATFLHRSFASGANVAMSPLI